MRIGLDPPLTSTAIRCVLDSTSIPVKEISTVFDRPESQPVFTEDTGVHLAVVFLHGLEPEHLEVEVVVGCRLALFELRVKGDGLGLLSAFKGHPKRSAYILAEPAGIDLVAELGLIEQDDRPHSGQSLGGPSNKKDSDQKKD